MRQRDADALRQRAQVRKKEKFLSHFIMDRYQRIIKQEDIKLNSLVPSLHDSNVISSNDNQSIKHYVELQRD